MMGTVALLADGDLLHLYSNPATTRFFGIQPGEADGRTARSLGVPDPVVAMWRRHYEQAAAVKDHVGFEYLHDTPYGPRMLSVTVTALTPPNFSYIAEDVTERRKAEASLQRTRRRLEMAVRSSRLGVWEWAFGDTAVHYSPRARDICGYAPGEPVTIERVLAHVHPDDLEMVRERTRRQPETPDEQPPVEYRIVHPQRGVRWVKAYSTVVLDDGLGAGRPLRLFGALEDITEQRDDEERLRLLMREVDHRANNLLTVVQSLVALTRAGDVEGYRTALSGRVQALSRAHQLLSDTRWTGTELRRLAEEELRPYGFGEDRRIRLSGDAVSLSPGQAQALGLALHELATNAAKYGALSLPGGEVLLEWREADGELILTWRERGGPRVTAPIRTGFGATVLARCLGGPLAGRVETDWAELGLTARIHLPMQAAC